MNCSATQRRKVKSGFTLIELLLVMVILAILAGVVVLAVGNVFGNAKEDAYKVFRDQIQVAVFGYASGHLGEMPPTVGAVDISGNKSILDVCSLTLPGEMLRTSSEWCILIDGSNNDNCDSGVRNCSVCENTSHYMWAIDAKGNIYSTCFGSDCAANGVDGYQDVWP